MKIRRVFFFTLTFALFLLIIGTERCQTPTGGGGSTSPPENLESVSIQPLDDGYIVRIIWKKPTSNTPVTAYRVYFRAADATNFTLIADALSDTFYNHNPETQSGVFMTGDYYAVGYNDEGEGEAEDTVSTIPVRSNADLYELHAPQGPECYGFSRYYGDLNRYAAIPAYVSSAEFYISDTSASYTGPNYHLVSVHYNDSIPADSATFAPSSWRTTQFHNYGIEVPSIAHFFYLFQSLHLCQESHYYIIKTDNNYYAAIKITDIDEANGIISVETYFQRIEGLRLVYYDEP